MSRYCGNCAYKDLLITQEPCESCLYSCNWEEGEEEEDDSDNTNSISLL